MAIRNPQSMKETLNLVVIDDVNSDLVNLLANIDKFDINCQTINSITKVNETIDNCHADCLFINLDLFNPESTPDFTSIMQKVNKRDDVPVIVGLSFRFTAIQQLTFRDLGISVLLASPINKNDCEGALKSVILKKELQTRVYNSIEKNEELAIDYKNILDLANGDVDFLFMLIQSYVEDIPEYFVSFNDAILAKDRQLLGQMAHKIKSPLNILGVKHSNDLLSELENWAESDREMDWENVKQKQLQLLEIYENGKRELCTIV